MPRRTEAGGAGGFTILELLLFALLFTALCVVALPRLLEPRRSANEAAAAETLLLLRSTHRAWSAWSGRPAGLQELAVVTLPPRAPDAAVSGRRLLPASLTPDVLGVARRGGYLFREAGPPGGPPAGCWAWPTLSAYSGRKVLWVDYASGALFEVVAGAGMEGEQDRPEGAPDPLWLRPLDAE